MHIAMITYMLLPLRKAIKPLMGTQAYRTKQQRTCIRTAQTLACKPGQVARGSPHACYTCMTHMHDAHANIAEGTYLCIRTTCSCWHLISGPPAPPIPIPSLRRHHEGDDQHQRHDCYSHPYHHRHTGTGSRAVAAGSNCGSRGGRAPVRGQPISPAIRLGSCRGTHTRRRGSW